MNIRFNGEPRTVTSTKLGAILKELDGAYRPGCVCAVATEKKGGELRNEFALKTESSEARIKIATEHETEAIALFHEIYPQFRDEQGRIAWVTEDVTAIGPLKTNLAVDKRERTYKKWEVFFGFGGFDPSLTYLMISKREHTAAYGTGEAGLIGKLTRGRSMITNLEENEHITEITPLVTQAERVGFVTTDLDTEIEEGQEIYTHMIVKLFPEAPMSCEHFLSLTRDDLLQIDDWTHTFIASSALKGLNLPIESVEYRSTHYLSVRNSGTDKGKIYVYKDSRLPNPAHNVFGAVTQGSDLIDAAQTGDTILTVTEPRWMMVVGRTQKAAEEFFEQADIEQVREGNQADDAVVVDQLPALTMEIMERGTVRTIGVDREAVLNVRLFKDLAPKTTWYFKKVTGLIIRPIGWLKVYFSIPGLVLFQGNADEAGTLVPENLPTKGTKRGFLGVTNMSRQNRGMMGIRLEDSAEYGPTGETPDGANIVLSISDLTPETLSFLSKLKEGDVIYVKEQR